MVLERMRRGYTRDDYRALVEHIREALPGTAVHTDVIVGFPGETPDQFQRTLDLLAELRLDKAHLAMYSPRTGTVSARRMPDDVPPAEKKRRWEVLDALQTEILSGLNGRLLGTSVEILVEERHRAMEGSPGGPTSWRWRGRTRQGRLVFFADPERDWLGKLADVHITWTGPWSLIGEVAA